MCVGGGGGGEVCVCVVGGGGGCLYVSQRNRVGCLCAPATPLSSGFVA